MSDTKEITTDAASAIAMIQQRYADLQTLAARLVATVKATKQPIPCKVVGDYNEAVADYLSFADQIFAQLHAQGVVIEQILYRDGKPVTDPKDPDKLLIGAVPRPLRPATFIAQNCPNAPVVAPESPLGALPAVGAIIAATAAAGRLIGPWLFRLGAGYLAVEGLKQVAVTARVVAGREDPLRVADAYTQCVEKAIAAGVPPTKAASDCGASLQGGWTMMHWLGLTVASGVAIGLAWWLWRQRGHGRSNRNVDDAPTDGAWGNPGTEITAELAADLG